MVGMGGLEPPTPTLSVWCSNQLSYMPQQPKCFYTNNTEDNTRNISFWQELPLTKKPRSMRGVLIPLAKLAGFHHYQIMVNLTTWK
jgi:hypothetical protein